MIAWHPGMSLESIEESIIKAAIKFYGNEERAAYSLKISTKDMQKKVKRFKEEEMKFAEIKEQQRMKQEEFVRRSRGIPAT